jgi:hypothetical protein
MIDIRYFLGRQKPGQGTSSETQDETPKSPQARKVSTPRARRTKNPRPAAKTAARQAGFRSHNAASSRGES